VGTTDTQRGEKKRDKMHISGSKTSGLIKKPHRASEEAAPFTRSELQAKKWTRKYGKQFVEEAVSMIISTREGLHDEGKPGIRASKGEGEGRKVKVRNT